MTRCMICHRQMLPNVWHECGATKKEQMTLDFVESEWGEVLRGLGKE